MIEDGVMSTRRKLFRVITTIIWVLLFVCICIFVFFDNNPEVMENNPVLAQYLENVVEYLFNGGLFTVVKTLMIVYVIAAIIDSMSAKKNGSARSKGTEVKGTLQDMIKFAEEQINEQLAAQQARKEKNSVADMMREEKKSRPSFSGDSKDEAEKYLL